MPFISGIEYNLTKIIYIPRPFLGKRCRKCSFIPDFLQ